MIVVVSDASIVGMLLSRDAMRFCSQAVVLHFNIINNTSFFAVQKKKEDKLSLCLAIIVYQTGIMGRIKFWLMSSMLGHIFSSNFKSLC